MRIEDFTASKPGRFAKTPEGADAFVPNPLPPKLELSWSLVNALSQADRALSELAGVARTLPNPHLLIGPFIRREAVLSSRIEGTRASLSDLFFFEAGGERDDEANDVREVANYVKALNYGLNRLKDLPVSLRLIREMHQHLLEGVRGERLTPGEFRQFQNWIGPPGGDLWSATYVPPPVIEMHQSLSDWEKYLHTDSELPWLIRLALIHYQFEAIHPFVDGNGRLGRLLITLMICHQGLLPQPLLYLSAYFEQYRSGYYELLLTVSQKGKWDEWIMFFLRGVEMQSQDAVKRAKRLLDLWQNYRRQVQATRASASPLILLDSLISHPAITNGMAANILGVTHRAARLNMNKLVELGIVKEITSRQRNQIFVATEIINILEAREA
ncbi:MAG: Fic family protein [Blastocatellales bacterium]